MAHDFGSPMTQERETEILDRVCEAFGEDAIIRACCAMFSECVSGILPVMWDGTNRNPDDVRRNLAWASVALSVLENLFGEDVDSEIAILEDIDHESRGRLAETAGEDD